MYYMFLPQRTLQPKIYFTKLSKFLSKHISDRCIYFYVTNTSKPNHYNTNSLLAFTDDLEDPYNRSIKYIDFEATNLHKLLAKRYKSYLDGH